MTPEIFTGNVIIQGITGSHGSFHALRMQKIGTKIVAGTSPNKAGTKLENIPVYASIKDIQADFAVDISVIFVPAPFAKAAILEAIDAGMKLIICITENIPVHDMLYVKQQLAKSSSVLVGPNCPGVYLPDVTNLGIIPEMFGLPGDTAIVSRSGTLTYEVASELSAKNIGQRYIIGIGGDPVHGVDFVDCLRLFQDDPEVKKIILIGEIGGQAEVRAAEYIRKNITKPVYAYITGHSAPKDTQLGHAGAILSGDDDTAQAKSKKLRSASALVFDDIISLVESLR